MRHYILVLTGLMVMPIILCGMEQTKPLTAHEQELLDRLYVLVRQGQTEDAKDLIRQGAPLYGTAACGTRDFLHLVVRRDDRKFVLFLVDECKMPFDTPDRDGFTPLREAVYRGYVDMARLFIDKGAFLGPILRYRLNSAIPLLIVNSPNTSINACDERGHTLLAHYLSQDEHFSSAIMRALLVRGALLLTINQEKVIESVGDKVNDFSDAENYSALFLFFCNHYYSLSEMGFEKLRERMLNDPFSGWKGQVAMIHNLYGLATLKRSCAYAVAQRYHGNGTNSSIGVPSLSDVSMQEWPEYMKQLLLTKDQLRYWQTLPECFAQEEQQSSELVERSVDALCILSASLHDNFIHDAYKDTVVGEIFKKIQSATVFTEADQNYLFADFRKCFGEQVFFEKALAAGKIEDAVAHLGNAFVRPI